MLDYPPASFNLSTMLATTPTAGSTTLVAINGMLPTAPSGQSLTPNPGSFFAMPSTLGSPNLVGNPNIPGGPFILPSTFPPTAPGLPCSATPYSSPQFQNPMLPFLHPNPTAMLTTNSSIPFTSPFGSPLPQLFQPQVSGAPLPGYPPAASASSVVTSLSSQPSLLSDPNPLGINNAAAVLTAPLPHSMVLSSIPLPISSPSNAGSADVLTFPMTAPGATNVATFSSLATSSSHTTPISAALAPSTAISGAQSNCSIAPSLQSSFKIDKAQPVIPGGNVLRPTTNSLLHLESMDFHRDEILDAIDKLRERKARPDFERISCMLKRYRNINPDQTQLCLGRLAAAGAVVCVDYKGNLSYRNPSKWRKTATRTGITNLPSVSARLVDAVRRLMAGTVYQVNTTSGTDKPLLPALPGPNGGYSLFQIEKALQIAEESTTDSGPSQNHRKLSILTGATLRVCLDREATHGKLAKTPDGRYVLDESGERKRLANISVAAAPHLLNKKPLPPNGSTLVSPSGNMARYARPSTTMAHIAPAGDPTGRPIIAKQPPTAISIAPHVGSTVNPLFSLSTRPGSNRRGRPPGSKSRKYSSHSEPTAPSEKKIKPEPTSVATITSLGDSSNPCIVSSVTSSLPCPTLTVSGMLTAKSTSAPPIISVNQNGFCAIPSPMTLPPSFVTGIPQSSLCSPMLSTPLLATSFPGSQPSDAPLQHTFGNQFLAFSTCSSAPVACSGPVPQQFLPTFSSGFSYDLTSLPKPISPPKSPVNTVASNSESEASYHGATEKSDVEGLCCHCGTSPTKEEAFLICKDCGLRAHPTCLDYWPELTERARQSPWQCTDCKTCNVCQNKQILSDLLICDACDKGFHIECHVPKLEEPVDRSLPWVCADCQKEGYSVAIGTLPEASDAKFENSNGEIGVEESKEQPTEDESQFSQDLNKPTGEAELYQESNVSNSKMEDLRQDSESASKEGVNLLNKSAVVDSSITSPTPTESQMFESNRLATPDSTVQNASPAPEALATRQDTPQERLPFLQDDLHGTSVSRNNASYSDKTRLSDSGVSPQTDHNFGMGQQDTSADAQESCALRDSSFTNTQDNVEMEQDFSHGAAQYRPQDVRVWSVDNVREWLLEEGFPREAEAFSQQEIDGACLLLMKRMDVLTELGIKLGPAVKIYERIKRLQSVCTSPTILGT